MFYVMVFTHRTDNEECVDGKNCKGELIYQTVDNMGSLY